MSRLSEWIDMQSRLLQHGSKVCTIRLRGPDDEVWGTWSIETEDLAEVIGDTMRMLGEGMPKGSYQVKIWAYDAEDKEVSMLPDTLKGAGQAATTAATEQLTLQKSTSAALYNAKLINEGLANQIQQLNSAIGTMQASNLELIDTVQKMAAENAERDIRDLRHNAVNDALIVLSKWTQQNAEPLLSLLLDRFGPKKPESSETPKRQPPPVPVISRPMLSSSEALSSSELRARSGASAAIAAPSAPAPAQKEQHVRQQPAEPNRSRAGNGAAKPARGKADAPRGPSASRGDRTSSSGKRDRTVRRRPRAARKP